MKPLHFLTACLLLIAAASRGWAAAVWREVSPGLFAGETAGWRFIVSAERARLVHAGPSGGENILLAGGHRAWLGPQGEWPGFWPPPDDWEKAPAVRLGLLPEDGATLVLQHARTLLVFPTLIRHYTLREDGLALTLSWRDSGEAGAAAHGHFQAMHLLQLREDALVTVIPQPTEHAPLGYGLLALSRRPSFSVDTPLPEGFAVPAAPPAPQTALTFAYNGRDEKFGFAPQPIVARMGRDGVTFRLSPPIIRGESLAPVPELGLTTQIYQGDAGGPLMEIEQLTPRLRAVLPGGYVSATVILEPMEPTR
jgi:hypothetical protein